MFAKSTIRRLVGTCCEHVGPGKRPTALAVLVVLATGSLAFAGPISALKIENMMRSIQMGVHMLAPPDGTTHAVALPGVFWATPYTWAGAPAAAVNGSAQHLVAPHAGETPTGPLHAYALAVTPGIPAPRAMASARLLHPGPLDHPDIFVEVLAANLNAAVFAEVAVHDPPPGNCPGLGGAPTGDQVVPPTPSEAVAASALNLYTPDGTLSLGLVVHGINQGDVISSAIHVGAPGTNGPPIFDLGPGFEWTDMDGIGIGRVIEDVPFPPEYVDALMRDDTYINVCTMQYPDGEIRGQIVLLPWDEDFDYYANGSDMHGQGGWKGWDNNPAFTALVTDEQPLSPPQSVEIAGDSDIVREFSGYTSGRWALTAWQYIPSDFDSNSADPFAGTAFIMLNTYEDGAHEQSDWSLQMNFDSNDGMLKVYHGNGLNTVDVPYVPEEWIEIQVVIDLDEDWTQVYYDDLLLSPATTPGDLNCDGEINFGDINPFVQALSDPVGYELENPYCDILSGDVNRDGETDFGDINPFVTLLTGG